MAWVLITGASSGIGRDVAVKLSERYSVILGGRDLARLEETKTRCNPNAQVRCWQCDISDVASLALECQKLLSVCNVSVEAFVHCAGYSKLVPVKMITLDDINATFNTNVHAPLVIVQQLVNRRINKGALKGVVLISSSISGRGSKAFSIYGSSKHAVDGLMRSLAVELAPRVRVNSVCPGAIRTRMTESIFSDEAVVERMKSACPLGLGNASNIADAVDFLLSDKSSWITGQALTVDGGATINITA